MSENRPELDRREFLVASGAVAAAPLLAGGRGSEPRGRSSNPGRRPLDEPEALPEHTCDLTVRWRHLVPRLPDSTLVAAWPMDEAAGYTMLDASGNGHDLYITGSRWNTANSGLTASFRRFGRRGGGVFLDGSQWLQGRHHGDFEIGSSGITISAWIRPTSLPAEGSTSISHDDSYALGITQPGAVRLAVMSNDGELHSVTSRAGAVTAGRWAHVTATANPSNGALRLWIDGSVVAQASVTSFAAARSTADLRVGDGLHGLVDEVVLNNRALGETGIRRLYLVGLPKLYTQARATIDPDRSEWGRYGGSDPIPHPTEPDTVFGVRFDGGDRSITGQHPVTGDVTIEPGHFGGAMRATSAAAVEYVSPISSSAGTVQVWYKTIHHSADPDRSIRKELFRAEGAQAWVSVYTEDGRWKAALGVDNAADTVVAGPPQKFVNGLLEHVAVSWGSDANEVMALVLYVNGTEVGRTTLNAEPAVFGRRLVIGGAGAPAYCQIDDVHVSNRVRAWGEICPRGHIATDSAGLDLRDSFHRASGTAPMWWQAGTDGGRWQHATKDWEDPALNGDAPVRAQALCQGADIGLHTAYRSDAYGVASSVEAGVSFDATPDGWAGVFIQATGPGTEFSGHTFAVNPSAGQLRLARYVDGAIVDSKLLPHDFPTTAEKTYELTLTAAGNDMLRGFVDGHNVISMRLGGDARGSGYSGLITENAVAYFDDVHFSALTPARPDSRRVQLRSFPAGGDITVETLQAVPFHWHKRRGLPPWQYVSQGDDQPGDPELAGNIAGADTPLPERPIEPAFWRSEDSANSDLITVDGRVIYFMRGNPRVDEHSYGARIGVLDTTVRRFDGLHFDDPSRGITDLDECKLVRGRDDPLYPEHQNRTPHLQVNNSGSAYVGDGRVLLFMNETRNRVEGYPNYRVLAYAHYDVRVNDWVHQLSQYVDWSAMDPGDPDAEFSGLYGTPELVSLRDADSDEYRVVLFHLSRDDTTGIQSMTTTGLRLGPDGVPQLDPQLPSVRSLSRSGTDANGRDRATKAIYNFRVLFDNGIYYLHYSEGPRVPDWPTHFPLAAALDPYEGPWVRNEDTNADKATYFTRGGGFEPDNAAIWQGCMVKHRGRYYMYYENFHAIDDINVPYQFYDHPHVGSRVGYAVAN